jgi:thioredoxin-like negative regulator of GroEL
MKSLYAHKQLFALLCTFMLGLGLGAGCPPLGAAPAPKAQDAAVVLAHAKQLMAQKKTREAIKLFEQSLQASNALTCDCYLCLGKAYCLQKDYVKARNAFRRAIRLGRGNPVARQANQIMMASIPSAYLKPKTGEGTELIASMLGVDGRSRGLGEVSKPKVFEFYADWCEPCKKLKPLMEKARAEFGGQVEFVSYNVDDARNEQFMDQYEVSPIPTVIYLTPDNKVVSYSIGYSGEQSLQKGLQQILANKTTQ